MSTTAHMNPVDLMRSFAEAGNALEMLPKVQADLDAATALIEETNSKLHATEAKAESLSDDITQLRAALAQKEAELSDATFRAKESQQALEHIQGVIGGLLPRPAAAEPAPSLSAEPAQTKAQGQSDAGESSVGETSTPASNETSANGNGNASPKAEHDSPASPEVTHSQPRPLDGPSGQSTADPSPANSTTGATGESSTGNNGLTTGDDGDPQYTAYHNW